MGASDDLQEARLITLPCLQCGDPLPVPEESGFVKCSRCSSSREFVWFNGPGAWNKFKLWRMKTGRIRPDFDARRPVRGGR